MSSLQPLDLSGSGLDLPQDESLPPSLQESLLALLSFDLAHGTTVALQVEAKHFDAPYQEIATKLLSYRREQGRPPGHAHLDDLFGWALERGEKAQRLRRLLGGITELYRGINAEYVAGRAHEFIRKQNLKAAIMRAGELYQQGGDDNVPQIEQVLYSALRHKQQSLDIGTFLSDTDKSLRILDRRSAVGFPLGLKELDKIDFGPSPKQLFLYIASKASGKSWFCVHIGRRGLIQRARVLHITLEMDEDEVLGRYLQTLFGVSRRNVPYVTSIFEYDELERLENVKTVKRKPTLSFSDPHAKKLLRAKMKPHGLRLGAILVKRFPTGQLSIAQLTTYLDYLETVEKFIPTIMIIDYPDLMKIDPRNQRLELGRIFVDLRGLAVERNLAVIAPTQGGRASIGAKRVKSNMVSEDISKVFTADNTLIYSRTKAEELRGLARLNVAHARNTEGGHEIVITQSYATGQYVLDSALMSSAYWEQLKLMDADEEGDEE